jgi:hypothetical protein
VFGCTGGELNCDLAEQSDGFVCNGDGSCHCMQVGLIESQDWWQVYRASDRSISYSHAAWVMQGAVLYEKSAVDSVSNY